MSIDKQYITLVNNIINNGYSQNNTMMMLPMQTIQFNTNVH